MLQVLALEEHLDLTVRVAFVVNVDESFEERMRVGVHVERLLLARLGHSSPRIVRKELAIEHEVDNSVGKIVSLQMVQMAYGVLDQFELNHKVINEFAL